MAKRETMPESVRSLMQCIDAVLELDKSSIKTTGERVQCLCKTGIHQCSIKSVDSVCILELEIKAPSPISKAQLDKLRGWVIGGTTTDKLILEKRIKQDDACNSAFLGVLAQKIKNIKELTSSAPKKDKEEKAKVTPNPFEKLEGITNIEKIPPGVAPLRDNNLQSVRHSITSGLPIALISDCGLSLKYFLANLATDQLHLGQLDRMLDWSKIIDVAKEMPNFNSILIVPVNQVVSMSRYDIGLETKNAMSMLGGLERTVILTGTTTDMYRLFSIQGQQFESLKPVTFTPPEIELSLLSRYEIVKTVGGKVSTSQIKHIDNNLRRVLKDFPSDKARNLVRPLAHYATERALNKEYIELNELQEFAGILSRSSNITNLEDKTKKIRSDSVQRRLIDKVYKNSDVEKYLAKIIYGQEGAIQEFNRRLRRHTRKRDKVFSCLLEGTPGIGKSELCSHLADYLGMRYIYINTAAFGNSAFMNSNLLGAAHGYVGSTEQGILETAACSEGAVIEVADLHAADIEVAKALSGLFLEILQTGQCRLGTGRTLSLHDTIIIFTINLPDGECETVEQGFGFNPNLTSGQVEDKIMERVKVMTSPAFMSRLGRPILFRKLDTRAIRVIFLTALKHTLKEMVNLCHNGVIDVEIDSSVVDTLLNSYKHDHALGARAIIEYSEEVCDRVDMSTLKSVSAEQLKLCGKSETLCLRPV